MEVALEDRGHLSHIEKTIWLKVAIKESRSDSVSQFLIGHFVTQIAHMLRWIGGPYLIWINFLIK